MRTPARLGTLLLLALAALPAVAQEPLEETALRLETKLMSPCCMSGTVADHGSGIAIQMRREIRTMLAKLATQLDSIELAGEPASARAHFVSGTKHLPVAYRFG